MCRTTYLSVLILCLSHVVNCERSPVVDRSHSLRLRGGSAVGSSYAPTGGAGAPVSNPSASTSAAQDKPPVTAAPQSYAPKAVQSYERPTESSYERPAAQSYERPAAQSYAPPQSYSKQIYATESAAEAPRPATPRPATPEPAGAEQLVGKVESITDGGAGKVTELAQKNRLLLQQCLALKERVPEGSATMAKIDARIRDLERAWNDYVHIQPGQTENLYKSRSVQNDAKTEEELWEEDQAVNRQRRKRIPVTFEVKCEITEPGDTLLITGDAEELGSWNSLAAIPMTTSNSTWPTWTATVMIPAGEMVEYKYFVGVPGEWLNQFTVKKWEQHLGNRGFKTPRKQHKVRDEFVWVESYDRETMGKHQGPSFVYMGAMDSQACFLDPEYACVFD